MNPVKSRQSSGSCAEINFNNADLTSIRQKMLRNEVIENCHPCTIEENANIQSYRQYANWRFPAEKDLSTTVVDEQIQYIEYFLGRSCNLKCVTCGSQNSTKWDYDSRILNLDIPTQKAISVDLSRYKNLKAIKFLGGEPLLSQAHPAELKAVSESVLVNLELMYFTNATLMPSEELLEIWKRARRVVIKLSIDATGDLNDYIRFPSRWKKIVETAEALRGIALKFPTIEIGVQTTVSALNVFNLMDIQQWFESFKKTQEGQPCRLRYSLLHEPSFLSTSNLPQELLNPTLVKYHNYGGQLADVARAIQLNRTQHQVDRLRKFIFELQEIRQNDICQIVPEIGKFFKQEPMLI